MIVRPPAIIILMKAIMIMIILIMIIMIMITLTDNEGGIQMHMIKYSITIQQYIHMI